MDSLIQKWNLFSALELYEIFFSHMRQEGQENLFLKEMFTSGFSVWVPFIDNEDIYGSVHL